MDEAAPSSRVDVFEHALRRLTPRVFVTYGLVAINLLVFAAMAIDGEMGLLTADTAQVQRWGATYGPAVTAGEWWRITAANFIHFGFVHIGFNMWVLASAGPLVERLLGNIPFLVMYLFAGALGSIASVAHNPMVIGAGASGAVFGVIGALLAVAVRQRDSIPMERVQHLRNSALAFVGYNVAFGFSIDGIDNAAHLGGLAGGFVCGVVLSQPIVGEKRRGRLLKSVVTAAAGLAITVGLGQLLPRDLPDSQGLLRAWIASEAELLDRVNAQAKLFDQGKIGAPRLIQELRNNVIPAWREARLSLDEIEGLPDANMKNIAKIKQYAKAREEGWEMLAEGLERDDPAMVERAVQKQTEAARLFDD